jgi:hypothetical protein
VIKDFLLFCYKLKILENIILEVPTLFRQMIRKWLTKAWKTLVSTNPFKEDGGTINKGYKESRRDIVDNVSELCNNNVCVCNHQNSNNQNDE